MHGILLGFALVFIAAIAGGGLAVPLKHRRSFELENIYVPSTLAMMLVIPFGMAQIVLPNWGQAIRIIEPGTLWAGAAFGFGWGVGAILFGYGVTLAGMSLGFAVIMGINTAIGSILPFVLKSPAQLFTLSGAVILLGIAGCIAGVAVCGKAGSIREHQVGEGQGKRKFALALAICGASGVLSSCANLGFTVAGPLSQEAVWSGARPVFSTLLSWMPVFWGASASLLLWFGLLQIKRGTWRKNFETGAFHGWSMGILMGIIWFIATIPYGMGAFYLGRLGTSIGWAVNIASSLIVANVFGFISGEWREAPAAALRTLRLGLGILVVSICLLAVGSSLSIS